MAPGPSEPGRSALAFIYDRKTSDIAASEGILRLRLEACREWAQTQGWEEAGEWIDYGDDALSVDQRPQLDSLLFVMRAHAVQRPVVCLVHDWTRLANIPGWQIALRRRVSKAGGWCETAVGDSDRTPTRRGSRSALHGLGR